MGDGPNLHGTFYLGRVLALALALRLAVPLLAYGAAGAEAFVARDTPSYLQPAGELARTGRFTRDGAPEILRTPGYPLLLVPGLLIGRVAAVTLALQALLGTATVYLVYGITRRLAPGRRAPALAAAVLYSVEPLAVLYGAKLLSETLFAFLLAAGLWALLTYLAAGRLRSLLLAAAVLVGAAYVRPIGYYLPGLLTASLAAWALAAPGSRRRRLTHVAAFALVTAAGLGAWHVRNRLVADYDGFSAVADVNLYFCQAAAVRAALDGDAYYRVQERWGYRDEETYLAAHPEQRPWGPGRRFAAQRQRALQLLAAHPLTYARIHLRGLARVLVDPGGLEYLRLFGRYPRAGGLLGVAVDRGLVAAARQVWVQRPAAFMLNAVLGAGLLACYVLAAAGLVGARPRGFGLVLVAAVILYLLLLSGGAVSLSRFRHPMMPALCALAGLGWTAVRGELAARLERVGRDREAASAEDPR